MKKIVFTEILPKVLSITDLFSDSTTINFSGFRTDKAFCFFILFLCTYTVIESRPQSEASLYAFLQQQKLLLSPFATVSHIYRPGITKAYLLYLYVSCERCMHMHFLFSPNPMKHGRFLSICWVLLSIRSWCKKIVLLVCENTDIGQFASR